MLLDENLPRQLAREIPGHEVRIVRSEGWSGVLNGELLGHAEIAGFEVFVTADRNLEHQQVLAGRSLGIVVLVTPRLKLEHLLPLVPELQEAVETVRPGQVLHVGPLL